MRPLKIILHHSADIIEGKILSWDDIEKYHKSYAYNGKIISKEKAIKIIGNGDKVKRPLKDIGFHFGIGKIGKSVKIIMGRFPYERGSHIDSENHRSLAICFVGNFDIDKVGEEYWVLGVKLVRYLQKRYDISKIEVYGHRDFDSSKTCPGKLFNIEKFREELLDI